jgi:hypothetical protein
MYAILRSKVVLMSDVWGGLGHHHLRGQSWHMADRHQMPAWLHLPKVRAALVWGYSVFGLPFDGLAADGTLQLATATPLALTTKMNWSLHRA